jgi:hypothetical protein
LGNGISNKPFYQPYTYFFFKEHTDKEKSNLKLVFYIILLQSFKTLQYKTKLTLSALQQLKSVKLKKKNSTTTGSNNNMLNSGKVLNRRLNDESKENTETCFSQISHHFNKLRTGDKNSRLWCFWLYNCERQMTQICLLTHTWILCT